jgi:hypothetical protein
MTAVSDLDLRYWSMHEALRYFSCASHRFSGPGRRNRKEVTKWLPHRPTAIAAKPRTRRSYWPGIGISGKTTIIPSGSQAIEFGDDFVPLEIFA